MLIARLSELALWLGGHLHGRDASIAGIANDTRLLQAGMLYVALRGDRLDGHAYLAQAKAGGADKSRNTAARRGRAFNRLHRKWKKKETRKKAKKYFTIPTSAPTISPA